MLARRTRILSLLTMLAVSLTLSAQALAEDEKKPEGKPEDKVSITKAGKAFHKKECKTIANSKDVKEVTREEAEKKNLKACKTCKP